MFKFEITSTTEDIKGHIATCINNGLEFIKIKSHLNTAKLEIPCTTAEINKLITDYSKLFDTATVVRLRIKSLTLNTPSDAIRRITQTPRYFELTASVKDNVVIDATEMAKEGFTKSRYDGLIFKRKLIDTTLTEFNQRILELIRDIEGIDKIEPYIVMYDSE